MTKELWFDDQQGQKPFQSSTAYKVVEGHSIQRVLVVVVVVVVVRRVSLDSW